VVSAAAKLMDLAAVAFGRFGGAERPAPNVRASARFLPAARHPVLSFSSRGSSLGDSFPGEPAENRAAPPGSAARATVRAGRPCLRFRTGGAAPLAEGLVPFPQGISVNHAGA